MTKDVPQAFTVRPAKWLGWIWAVSACFWIASAITGDSPILPLIVAAASIISSVANFSSRSRVTPNGITFSNPIGQDWSRSWAELSDIKVASPSATKALVTGRRNDGHRFQLRGGHVTNDDGNPVAPDTAQGLVQGWVRAGESSTSPEDPTGD
ncbi:MAG: hypothetical protein ACI867_000546 [Glaciecola sp.]|jgi:hypothetical protein